MSNELRTMNYEQRTMNYELRLSAVALAKAETMNYEQRTMNYEQRTTNYFLQNKPDFPNAQMNITSVISMNYELRTIFCKTTPISRMPK